MLATTTSKARQEASVLLAVAGAMAMTLVYVVAVRTPQGQALDTRAMTEVASALAGQTWTSTVLSFISPLSVIIATLSIAGLTAIARGLRAALSVLAVTGTTVVGAALLKAVLVRPELANDATNSLPSGHVAAVAALAVAATMAVPTIHRGWVAIAGSAATAATGIATLALEWHRPSDVVAATLLAITVGGLGAAFQRPDSAPPRDSGTPRVHLFEALSNWKAPDLTAVGPQPNLPVPHSVTELRHPNTRLQQEQIAELLAAYLNGEGITALARRFGVNYSTIRNHIRRSDIGFRESKGLSPAQRDELARQYLAGATIKELSERFGVGTATVHRSLNRTNTPRRPKGRRSSS